MMLSHILAKSKPIDKPETLVEHTDQLVAIWLELRNRYQSTLPVDESFWFDSFIVILFHDFGKISQNFQDTLRKSLLRKPSYPHLEHIRHEFLSGMLLAYHSTHPIRIREDLEPNYAQVFAVLTHHKNFIGTLFEMDQLKQWELHSEDFNEFLQYVKLRVSQYYPLQLGYLKNIEDAWQLLSEFQDDLGSQYEDKNTIVDTSALLVRNKPLIGNEYRKQYILHKAILCISDWTASGHIKLDIPLHFTHQNIYDEVAKRAKIKNINFNGFRDFQLEAGRIKGNVLAIAPTGSGKTEAALLWASNREEDFFKIVYLLPTRVTANSLYRRMKDYFEIDNTNGAYIAVVHSSAKLFREELDENYDDFSYHRESAFFKAMSVATVDQILTQGFNIGRWELKSFHLFRAKVIVDEVHAYAPYTLGLLIATIQYLRKNFQTQFFIMTATMPTQLQDLLTDALGNDVEVIRDQQLLDAKRNKYRVEDKSIDELFPEIRERLRNNSKILIVVNSVNEAIRLYDAFNDQDCFCYHSRFTVQDRTTKENQIESFEKSKAGQPFLLIATQVVEVSLDIDYDYLYSENAPIDAIIQRAGRINRKRSKPNTEVVVYKHLPISEKIYDSSNILENTFHLLKSESLINSAFSENDLLKLVDRVYEHWKIKEDPSYKEGLSKYATIQSDHCAYVRDFDLNENDAEKILTREGLDTVTIIPMIFKDKLLKEEIKTKIKYGVTIRRKLFEIIKRKLIENKIPTETDIHGFTYLDVPYSSEKGLCYSFEEAKKIYPKDPHTFCL